MFIDTHAHLYLEQFDEDLDEVIARAQQAGIDKILMPNVDLTTLGSMLQVAASYPGTCFPMMGLHPCSVDLNFEKVLLELEPQLNQDRYIAIGEIGIDLYWDKTFLPQQIEAFKIQVQWASQRKLPVVIHSRESIEEILDILENLALPGLTGVFHCFTGNEEQASRIEELGFYLGIGGVVTFKNGGLDKIMPHLDIDRIILETDAPYLAPHPYRGKRNESAYIQIIAEKVAQLLECSEEELGERTTTNAMNLFARLNQPN